MPPSLRYSIFSIRKKGGGSRQISAPDKNFRIVQAKLAQVLQAIYRPRPSTHGFTLRRSIVTNATPHTQSRHVFNVDLKDFFPSINFGRVRGMFIAEPYNVPHPAATVLAQICTHNNGLPQGAPTSPLISNMICSRLDSQLKKLAATHYCRYSRYADDITFSKSSHHFPREISLLSATGIPVAGEDLRRVIETNGFRINEAKVRHQVSSNRQVVTGLVVNRKVNVPRSFIKNIRGAIHAHKKFGPELAQKYFAEKFDKPGRIATKSSPDLLNVLRGKIEFIGMVKGIDDATYRNLQRQYSDINPDYLEHMLKQNNAALSRDIFISHASEDKDALVRPLARELVKLGCKVWYDEYELKLGDSLRAKIDDGLSRSRNGLVVLSPHFFRKPWPKEELDGLTARAVAGKTLIIPVFHQMTAEEVSAYSPTLAGKMALITRGKTIEGMAKELHTQIMS